ncbi:LPXTG cell wall anchor domain-containing protein [Streptomyces sp. AJS327]|uniref:LPXTG cell wall anchor domain-containing protein n=1 Tax=Streptomyces sp. AJS327 TaxID=2545265 RepID=UPI0035B530F6
MATRRVPGGDTEGPGGDTEGPGGDTEGPGGDTEGPGGDVEGPGGDTEGTGGDTEGQEPATVGGGDGGNTDPDAGGSVPVEEPSEAPGKDAPAGSEKDELAETGSAETTFLLVGAATMIAGGIGFRLMPRLVTRRTAA